MIDNFIVFLSVCFGIGGILKSLIIGGVFGFFFVVVIVFWREYLSCWIS